MVKKIVIARGSSGDKSVFDGVEGLEVSVDSIFNKSGVLVFHDPDTGKELTISRHGTHQLFDEHAYKLAAMAEAGDAIVAVFHGGQSLQAPSQLSAIGKIIPVIAVPTGGSYFGGTSGISAIFDVPRAAVGLVGSNQYAKAIGQAYTMLSRTPESGVYLIEDETGTQKSLLEATAKQMEAFGIGYGVMKASDIKSKTDREVLDSAIVLRFEPTSVRSSSLNYSCVQIKVFPEKPEPDNILRGTDGLVVLHDEATHFDGTLIKETNVGIFVAQIAGLTNPGIREKVLAYYAKLRDNPSGDAKKHYTKRIDDTCWR